MPGVPREPGTNCWPSASTSRIARWNRARIAEGLDVLDRALARRTPGRYQIQAAVAALHAEAPTFADTDWHQIALLYAELERYEPTPVVAVNRAIAVGHHEGPDAALALLEPLGADPRLSTYQPYHAARADLLARTGDRAAAFVAYQQAIALTGNEHERRALERRAAAVT